MRIRGAFLSLALVGFASGAQAQTWSPEEQEIWQFEQEQWRLSAAEDPSWIDTMVHPNLSYWDTDRPGPQNKESLARWSRYGYASGKVLEQEIFPISITITGNVAVVHYNYTSASENAQQEREVSSGRYTDVLVKENGRWLFLTWAGGDYPQD